MMRIGFLALCSAFVAACSCDPALSCETSADCNAGQICVQKQCRATASTGGGSGAGTSGGGTGTGGAGGGTVVTGCDPTLGAANLARDTDCDGLSDAEEYGATTPTNPCNADSDGDGLSDGLESGKTTSVVASCTFVGDADPNSLTNPNSADSDGDGVSDGDEDANHDGRRQAGETDPVRSDTDCDGYSDGEERMGTAGCVTDGTKIDTDGDGLQDGVEGGLVPPGADTVGCAMRYANGATFDADNTTHTNACSADTDGDGIADGAEDTNLNGRVDTGELNPNDMSDGTGTAQQACATANLKPITFNTNGVSDVQLALTPSFSEVNTVQLGGIDQGFVFYDPTNKVGGLALSFDPSEVDATSMELVGRGKIGGVASPLVQTFTTWDGFASSVRATYDVSGNQDAKARINAIVTNYVGGAPTGLLTGAAGATGPFKVIAEYVFRSATRGVVVIAIVPASLYTGQAFFNVDDAAGGTALAQFGDYANAQCEVFDAKANAKVDFLWVVDDSCSMASSQTATANASTIFASKLASAGLDWRAAGVSTAFFPGANPYGSSRPWTTDLTTMRGWFSGGSSFGTGGDGQESGFISTKTFMNTAGGAFRADAQGHLIFLSDTKDQSSGLSAAQMLTFLQSKVPTRVVAHGILCPEGQSCEDDAELNPGKYQTLIRATGGVLASIEVFKDASQATAQAATIDAILNAVIGGTGQQLQRPPIAATIKVAVAAFSAGGSTCNGSDVARSRTNGWDIDAATRRLVFFGNCIPQQGAKVAVSYKYWNDGSPNASGDACGGTCAAPLVCDPNQRSCVCAPNCGGCGAGFTCNTTSCACVPELG